MRWRQPADPAVARAIVAAFRQPPDQTRIAFARFSPAAWHKTWFWLDASGLALYFLSHAEQCNFVDAIHAATLDRLRRIRDDNRDRTATLLEEFIALNHAFLAHRVFFANLKGFTLVPDSCASPDLRLQLDFDFLIAAKDLPTCQWILEERGYRLSAKTNSTWEFKAGDHASAKLSNPYQKTPFRSVELHFSPDLQNSHTETTDERLNQLSLWHYEGHSFPALTASDQFVGQAMHILAHLRSATTRPQWLLEFARHASARSNDLRFWRDVRQLARGNPLASIALGVSALIARETFGLTMPLPVLEWAEECLPENIRLWVDRYGQRALMANFPGTKLYLLLERELALCSVPQRNAGSCSALPAFRIPKLFYPQPADTFRSRLLRWSAQSRYFLFRLRFHVVEGLRYHLEARRWEATRFPRLQHYATSPRHADKLTK